MASGGPPFEEGTGPIEEQQGNWTVGGPGSAQASLEEGVDAVQINADGTGLTYARRVFPVEPGREYTFSMLGDLLASTYQIGSFSGGDDLAPRTLVRTNLALPVGDWLPAGGGSVQGTGTVTIDPELNGMIITPVAGATTSIRRVHAIMAGVRYRLTWTLSENTAFCLLGTSNGGQQYKTATASDQVGVRTFEFDATSDTLWMQFQRSAAGATVVSNIILEQITLPALDQTISVPTRTVVGNVAIPMITTGGAATFPNLFLDPATWLANGGLVSDPAAITLETNRITINANGTTAASTRKKHDVVIGKTYRLTWTVFGGNVFTLLGTANGGGQYKSASSSDAIGPRSFEFTATSVALWIQFQRTLTGAAGVTDITLQEVVVTIPERVAAGGVTIPMFTAGGDGTFVEAPPDISNAFAAGAFVLPMIQAGGAATRTDPFAVDVATFIGRGGGAGGTFDVNTVNRTITITATQAVATYIRGSHPVTVGTTYKVLWQANPINVQAGFGTSEGGPQYQGTTHGVVGQNEFTFTATTATLWLNFQRVQAGTVTVSNIRVVPQ